MISLVGLAARVGSSHGEALDRADRYALAAVDALHGIDRPIALDTGYGDRVGGTVLLANAAHDAAGDVVLDVAARHGKRLALFEGVKPRGESGERTAGDDL